MAMESEINAGGSERMRHFIKCSILILMVLFVVIGLGAHDATNPLKRRGFFGAQLGPMNVQVKKTQKIATDDGAEVRDVIPGSAAEAGGILPGDVLVAINGAVVKSPAHAVATISARKAGDVVALDLIRETKKLTLKIPLKERPRESSEQFETIYGEVTSKSGRLRTIVTRPRAPGKYPALLFIQGLGCGSVESAPGWPTEFKLIADDLTGAGYVTLRVEKPGCGDSEGGPCEDVDFITELDGYRQALKTLKHLEFVDANKVFLFGHSLGGLWAPMLAVEEPVKGIAVYGTVFKPWYEYELENRRRQLILGKTPYPEIDRELRNFSSFLHYLYVEKKGPKQIVSEHPDLSEVQQALSPDGVHMYGRSVVFMQQVAALPISEYWSKVDAHVLAMWGKSEYVSTEADHRMLADLFNFKKSGRGTFLALDGIDHGMHQAASTEDRYKAAVAGVRADFNPVVIEALRGWIDPLGKDS
jgi:pimeloyl-ACP methyl ester carboxylesterase